MRQEYQSILIWTRNLALRIPLADGGIFALSPSQKYSSELKGYPASGFRLILISSVIRLYVAIKCIYVFLWNTI